MEKFIEMLKEKGVIARLQRTVNAVPSPENASDEEIKEQVDSAVGTIILMELSRDDELNECFDECAVDMFMTAVVKTLDIKKDPDAQEQSFEALMNKLIGTIIGTLFE